jgi:hypothetical protein
VHGADYHFFVRPPAKQLEPEPEVGPQPPPPTTAESSQGSDESGWESESSYSDEDDVCDDDVRLPDLFAPDMAAFPQLSRCRLYGG